MVDYGQLAGAFGSVVENRDTVAVRAASAQALGAFGIQDPLKPYTPAPTAPPPPVGTTANVSQADQQPTDTGLAALFKRYQRVILIVAGVALAAALVLRKRKK